jgi:hypothetical protein
VIGLYSRKVLDMPDPQTSPVSTNIGFQKQLPFRSGALGIDVSAAGGSRLYNLIVGDQPFTDPGDLPLGEISIKAAAGKDFTFDSPKGAKASFAASASASAGVGLYRDVKKVLVDAGFKQNEGMSLSLPQSPDSYYLLFKWGYDIQGSASGSVALGAPSVRFAADASREGRYAILCRHKNTTGARTALQSTLENWIIPCRLDDPALLSPGTWLLTEVDGALSIKLDGTYGYDFSWVREAQLAGLNGDLGLKIQMGVQAQLGYSASGSYAVVVSRDNAAPVVRVRIFKGAKKGWQFSLDARAGVTPTTGEFLPGQLDDFILAVLGTHPQQLLSDLKELRNWTSGTAPLSGVLANIGADYLNNLLSAVYNKVVPPPPGSSPAPFEFKKAKSAVLHFLDTWGGLDSKLSSLLWSILGKAQTGNAGAILADAKRICDNLIIATPDSYARLIESLCSQSNFLSSPAGQWLETLALGNLLAPITDSKAFKKMQKAAGATGKLLETGSSENAVLQALHEWIDPRFKLPIIKKQLETTLSEEWIRAKLASFLDRTVVGRPEIQQLQKLIALLEGKAAGFYEKAVKALNDTYNLSFSSAFQTATTDTALLDMEFDFQAGGHDIKDALACALSGNFDRLLLQPVQGIKLNRGVLSHGVSRHSTLQLKLPFYFSTLDHINKSLAKADCVDADSGRLMVYQVDAEDEVSAISNRGGNNSHMTLTAAIPASRGNNVRVFDSQGGCTYSYRQALKDMNRAQLQYQLKPYIDAYLPSAFASAEGSFDAWLSELEHATNPPIHRLGYTLVSLDLSVPGSALAAWWNAPEKRNAPEYMQMSLELQMQLKKLLPFYYFADVSNYEDLDPAFTLLAYSCIPISTSVRAQGNSLKLNTNQTVYWDWMQPGLRRKMLADFHTQAKLRAVLPAIYQRLQASGLGKTARFYEPGELTVQRILKGAQSKDELLKSLLLVEAEVVCGALDAGLAIAEFRRKQDQDIKIAVRALGKWGAKVVGTFNQRVRSVYGGDAVRPLGTMIMATAANSLAGNLQKPSALLRVIILRPDSTFPPADFLRGTSPDPDEAILIQQSIVEV